MKYDLFAEPEPVLKARTSLIPRDYQQRAINSSFRLWDEGHVGVLCRLPTGAGKTLTGTLIADLWLQRSLNHRVLIVAHERQLIDQFAQEVEDILHVRPAVEMAGQHCKGDERIIVASRQTLQSREINGETVSRLFKFRQEREWLLILDEAHRWARKLKQCAPILEWFEPNQQHRRLGLTATPERTDKTTFAVLFPAVSSDYRLHDVDGGPSAVNDGWAVPYDQRYIVVEGVDFKNIPEVSKDFDPGELEKVLGEQETLARLCDPMIDLVGKRKTLIFSPTTAMAKNVSLYLNARMAMQVSMSIDGGCPDAVRKSVYRDHQSGQFQFLSVCGLCREGYNDPDIQAVAIFRPTKSRSLAEQMKGRGCRTMRGTVSSEMTPEERRRAIAASHKPSCMVIDLVGATGLGDVPSTVDILAEGKPDEVRERATKKLLAQSPDEAGDVQKAIVDAEAEISEEKRLARERRLREEQEEADRRAKLKANVSYSQRKVKSGQVGKGRKAKRHKNPPTEGMCKFLWALGVKDPHTLSMNQAKGLLGKLSGANGGEYVVRGGEHRGKRLRELPIPELKALIAERNTGSRFDNEFQANVSQYREEYRREHQHK